MAAQSARAGGAQQTQPKQTWGEQPFGKPLVGIQADIRDLGALRAACEETARTTSARTVAPR